MRFKDSPATVMAKAEVGKLARRQSSIRRFATMFRGRTMNKRIILFGLIALTLFACGNYNLEDSIDSDLVSSSSSKKSSSSSKAVLSSSSLTMSKCGNYDYDPATHICKAGELEEISPSSKSSSSKNTSSSSSKETSSSSKTVPSSSSLVKLPSSSSETYSSSSSKETKCDKNPQSYDPNVYECKPEINSNGIYLKQKPKDSQGNEYEAVQIGSQIWMAENLNLSKGKDGNSIGRCFEDKPANCEKFGRMYILAEVKCPTGYRLPSSADVAKLLKYVDPSYKEGSEGTGFGNNSAGPKLKAKSEWPSDYEGKDGNGTDDYGFNALPGGYCGTGCGAYEEDGEPTWSILYPPVAGSAATPSSRANTSSFWWTTSKGTPVALAITWRISSGVVVDDAFQSYDTSLFYARCLKDK